MLNPRQLLLLAGGCLGAWAAPEPPPPALPGACILLEADASLFATPAGAQLRDGWLRAGEQQLRLADRLGFQLRDLSHATVEIQVGPLFGLAWSRPSYDAVFRLEAKQDLFARLQAAWQKPGPDQLELRASADGRTLATAVGKDWLASHLWATAPAGTPGLCIMLANHRLRVHTDKAGKLELLTNFKLQPTNQKDEPVNLLDCPLQTSRQPGPFVSLLREHGHGQVVLAMRRTYGSQLVLAGHIRTLREWLADKDGKLLPLDWLLDLDAVVVSFQGGDRLTATAIGIFPDEAVAEAAAKSLANNLGLLCGILDNPLNQEDGELVGALQELLQGLKMERQGRTIRLTAIIPARLLDYPTKKKRAAPSGTHL